VARRQQQYRQAVDHPDSRRFFWYLPLYFVPTAISLALFWHHVDFLFPER
jgi:hypothetical protein